jgi:hypothetical protein
VSQKFPLSFPGAPDSPFNPGDLVTVKAENNKEAKQGTVTRTPSPYYSEVHVNGRRLMLPNEWLVLCNEDVLVIE